MVLQLKFLFSLTRSTCISKVMLGGGHCFGCGSYYHLGDQDGGYSVSRLLGFQGTTTVCVGEGQRG